MKKRFLSVLLVSAMGVAALAGCGGGNTSADNGSTAADQMGAAVEDKTDAADTQKEDTSSSNEKLVVYTNSGTEGRDAYLIEKAKEAGFDIEVVALGASEVTERMIAEKNNPLCDVTFGLNNIEYEKLKSKRFASEMGTGLGGRSRCRPHRSGRILLPGYNNTIGINGKCGL